MSGSWKFPSLLTITTTPTMRTDGSVHQQAGYDASTRVFFDPGGVVYPAVPDEPDRDQALEALAKLKYVLKDFPFATEADRAVLLAAILTALVRPALRSAPLFGISAPKMASGKSLLADIIALIATGRVGDAMPQGKDEDEERKRLLAVLKEGDPIAVIDNVERPLGGGALCAALTQEVYRDRILGSTRTVAFPTCVTWIATGNNLVVEGDLTTRTLIARLDPRVERPEERTFDIEPRSYVTRHRGALVVAGLTVLRAYVVAGRPPQDIPPYGRFEDFSDLVRSALVWLDEADPCTVRARIEEEDPERQFHSEVMDAWLEVFGPASKTAAEVVSETERGTSGWAACARLRELLLEVAAGPAGTLLPRRLGMWLASKRDRIEAGMQIVQIGQRHRAALWAVLAPHGGCADISSPTGAGKSPQTHKTHPGEAIPVPSRVSSGESCESWGTSRHALDANCHADAGSDGVDGGRDLDCDSGTRRQYAGPDGVTTTAARSGWPSVPCYHCRSTEFWRLRDAGRGEPGEPRCQRCHPGHPADHLVEFSDITGGAA